VTWLVRDLEPADDVLPGSAERSHDRLVADRALSLTKCRGTIIVVRHGWWSQRSCEGVRQEPGDSHDGQIYTFSQRLVVA
jgi:hypothetical protein